MATNSTSRDNPTDSVTQTGSSLQEKPHNRYWIFIGIGVLVIFGLGLALRLYDLTDQPVDFHPTRQLRGAIIARGIYYQMSPTADPETRQQAISFIKSTGKYEPSILEWIVASTYRLAGEEHLWIARLYTILFWIIGGVALFGLALRMTNYALAEEDFPLKRVITYGSIVLVLAYYFVLPFGVQASRSFQPDPGMVMWILLSMYTLYRWSENREWKWALLTGLLAGLAILTKAVSIYIVAGAAVAVVLYTLGFKRSWRDPQVWSMAVLMISPAAVFYLGKGDRTSEYLSGWTVSLSHLLLQPAFYMRWLNFVQDLMGLTVLLLAFTGVLISKPRNRALLIGLWAGYVLYGLFLPYQMYTHNYYHLQLIPIISISLLPIVGLILTRIVQQSKVWQALFVVVILVGVGYLSWIAILPQYAQDHRQEPAYWEEIASHLPEDGKIMALTQDYGFRLMYYGWRKVTLWPNRAEQKLMKLRGSDKDFEEFFNKRTDGKNYFMITSFNQFDDQPALKQYLYDNYPILAEGEGYLIFDIRTSPQ
jgi:hypothetical protein